MSVAAMAWAWRQDVSPPAAKLVLLALADHAGDDGTCFPGTGSIGAKTGLSKGQVRRHIDALEASGHISKIERRRRGDGTLSTWMYQVHSQPVDSHRALTRTGDPTSAHPRTNQRASTHQPGRVGARAEPSLNPQKNLPPSPPDVFSSEANDPDEAGKTVTIGDVLDAVAAHALDNQSKAGRAVSSPAAFKQAVAKQRRADERWMSKAARAVDAFPGAPASLLALYVETGSGGQTLAAYAASMAS